MTNALNADLTLWVQLCTPFHQCVLLRHCVIHNDHALRCSAFRMQCDSGRQCQRSCVCAQVNKKSSRPQALLIQDQRHIWKYTNWNMKSIDQIGRVHERGDTLRRLKCASSNLLAIKHVASRKDAVHWPFWVISLWWCTLYNRLCFHPIIYYFTFSCKQIAYMPWLFYEKTPQYFLFV